MIGPLGEMGSQVGHGRLSGKALHSDRGWRDVAIEAFKAVLTAGLVLFYTTFLVAGVEKTYRGIVLSFDARSVVQHLPGALVLIALAVIGGSLIWFTTKPEPEPRRVSRAHLNKARPVLFVIAWALLIAALTAGVWIGIYNPLASWIAVVAIAVFGMMLRWLDSIQQGDFVSEERDH